MSSELFADLITAIGTARTVFMTAHVGPDGDTLGSMLALKFALEKARPNIQSIDCVISGKMPDVYSYLPGIRDVLRVEQHAEQLQSQYDLAISVDCGSLDRLGLNSQYFDAAVVSVNIDHHISNNRFGKLNLVVPEAAASGEVVFDFLKEAAIPLDANIATCLYTAIVTDTGGFKYGNTTAKVMETAASLIQAGASPEYIFKQLYEEQPLAQLSLQADAFLRAQYNADQTVGWTLVSKLDMTRHGALDEHVDGLVESIRRVKSVLISGVFKEMNNGFTKVSLRSDSHDIDVSAIMGKFGGGGHKMASGCTIESGLDKAQELVLPLLEDAVRKKLLVR